MISLSIVIPVYNEAENVKELHTEIKEVCEQNNYQYEIIFIDDGSTDKTENNIKSLSPVKLISFRKNFGQTAAMDAGIKSAKYEYVITLDGDGQNNPKDIPRLIEFIENSDVDVVSGWRKHRKDNFAKHFVSRVANILRKILINDGINDSGCTLKVYKKECFLNVSLYGEMHRFIPALLKIKGFKIGEIIVDHRPRTKGKTKYGIARTLKGLIDMISVWFWNKYSVRPLHFLGGLGFAFIFSSIITGIMSLVKYLSGSNMSNTALPILTAFLFLSGIQFFISGLITDILLKSYFETTKNNSYNIKRIYVKEAEK
jgi:glycosyltransferase involved in cell wall biosynthesis